MKPEERDILGRALGYPYEVPPYSYLYVNGTDAPIEEAEFAGRVPVVAYGSNASPIQLHRKFGKAHVPVTRAVLKGYDVVYAALFARYGSVPATVHPSEGTEAFVHATWLTRKQLEVMHETEGAETVYRYETLPAGTVTLSDSPTPDAVTIYAATAGPLGPEPLALASIPAKGRSFPAADQATVLRRVRDHLAPEMVLEDFVLEIVRDPDVRRNRAAHLSRLTS